MNDDKTAKKIKRLGWFVIASLWVLCGVLLLVGGSLLLMYIDSRYLLSSQIIEKVTVVKLRGNSYSIDSEIPNTTMFIIKFPSGEKKEVDFIGDLAFNQGTKLNLNYKKTKLFNVILVDNYEIIR